MFGFLKLGGSPSHQFNESLGFRGGGARPEEEHRSSVPLPLRKREKVKPWGFLNAKHGDEKWDLMGLNGT